MSKQEGQVLEIYYDSGDKHHCAQLRFNERGDITGLRTIDRTEPHDYVEFPKGSCFVLISRAFKDAFLEASASRENPESQLKYAGVSIKKPQNFRVVHMRSDLNCSGRMALLLGDKYEYPIGITTFHVDEDDNVRKQTVGPVIWIEPKYFIGNSNMSNGVISYLRGEIHKATNTPFAFSQHAIGLRAVNIAGERHHDVRPT